MLCVWVSCQVKAKLDTNFGQWLVLEGLIKHGQLISIDVPLVWFLSDLVWGLSDLVSRVMQHYDLGADHAVSVNKSSAHATFYQ